MAGTVYLRTNRFEVKLEGITFKAKDFEYLCTEDFLFPKGKIWVRRPLVGIDVIHHPRDPTIVLVLLCFGLGCVILRFHSGAALPDPILKFLTDERICFVGFGIPEKRDLFPFEQLGLTKQKADIGYLAAKFFNTPKYKRCDLGDLARKVLGIRRMIGLADSSSFERHEQIKCGICQLFISTVIAISLFSAVEKKKVNNSPKKSSFLMNLSSLPLLTEGWLKLSEGKIREQTDALEKGNDLHAKSKNKEGLIGNCLIIANSNEDTFGDNSFFAKGGKEGACGRDTAQNRDTEVNIGDEFASVKGEKMYSSCDYLVRAKVSEDDLVRGEEDTANDDSNEAIYMTKKPLKGIFKCLFPLGTEHFNPCTASVDSEKETIRTPKKPLKGILKCHFSSNAELHTVRSPSPSSDASNKEAICIAKKPLKGILKCPSSSTMERCNLPSAKPGSPPLTFKRQQNAQDSLRRANSKGHNVSFKCD